MPFWPSPLPLSSIGFGHPEHVVNFFAFDRMVASGVWSGVHFSTSNGSCLIRKDGSGTLDIDEPPGVRFRSLMKPSQDVERVPTTYAHAHLPRHRRAHEGVGHRRLPRTWKERPRT